MGAVLAHLTIGDPIEKSIPALVLLLLVSLSYLIWQKYHFPIVTKMQAS